MLDDPRLSTALLEVAEGRSRDPFAVLGRHSTPSGDIVRVMLPGAFAVTVVARDERARQSALSPLRQTGLFVGPAVGPGSYLLCIDWGGPIQETEDPYSFGPLLGELDVYLLAEGKHHDLAACLGAHALVVDGVPGVRFAVWGQMRGGFPSSATSTPGTGDATRCGCATRRECGRFLFHASRPGRSISTSCLDRTARCCR